MADERLTDQTVKTDKPEGTDLVHLVDVSNTTDHASGTSAQMTVDDFLKGRSFKPILGCLVYSFVADPSKTAIVATDWVIYMNEANTRIVIGIAKAGFTTVPAHFDDDTKFTKFYDGNSLI